MAPIGGNFGCAILPHMKDASWERLTQRIVEKIAAKGVRGAVSVETIDRLRDMAGDDSITIREVMDAFTWDQNLKIEAGTNPNMPPTIKFSLR